MKGARSIAAAQTVPIRGDIDANVEQHVLLVRAAADAGAQLVVFPELSLTGYELDLAAELAVSEADPRLAPLSSLASSQDMTVVVGAPVRIGGRLHIGAFIMSPDHGVGLYTKQHLGAFPAGAAVNGIVPPAEETIFHAGTRNPLVRFGDHTAAVAVCADINRPSHPEEAASRGAATYLASMFIIPSDLEKDAATLRAYAARNRMAVVVANFGGPSGGLPAAGGSAIWSESGELLVQLPEAGSGVAVATESDLGWHGETILLGRS